MIESLEKLDPGCVGPLAIGQSRNGSQSDECNVVSGVPQGLVLGPLLFLIYVNDLPRVISSPSLLFADDTKLF